MAPWYEEAEFYHIYPIGLTGAPRKNESEETVHRFSTLEQWLPHIADLGCTAIYISTCLNQPHMDTTQKITNR